MGMRQPVVGKLTLWNFLVPFLLSWWCWFNVFDFSNFELRIYVMVFCMLVVITLAASQYAYHHKTNIPPLLLALIDGGLMFFTVELIYQAVNILV